MRPLVLGASLVLAGCQLPTLGGSDAGADDAGSSGDDAGTSGIVGADCTAVAAGTTICQAISACPDTMLDPRAFPHCGYRVNGNAIDLECYCITALCPIGVASTCADIAGLVQDQDEDTVCAQEGVGRCVSLTGGAQPSSSGSASSGVCNPGCTDGCGNTPACQQACGC